MRPVQAVEIRPATLRDACFVAAHMRRADYDEIAAVVRFDNVAQVAAILLHNSPGLAFCAFLRGEPVAAYGMCHNGETICSGWAYGTERLRRVIPAITDHGFRVVGPELLRRGYKRLEVRTAVDHDLSHRWLEGMGFTREGVLRSFGFNGEDFAMYSLTEKDEMAHVLRRRTKRPAAAASGAGVAAAADPRGRVEQGRGQLGA